MFIVKLQLHILRTHAIHRKYSDSILGLGDIIGIAYWAVLVVA